MLVVLLTLFLLIEWKGRKSPCVLRLAVAFDKFSVSPICCEQMLFPLLHGYGLMCGTCYRKKNFDRMKTGKLLGKVFLFCNNKVIKFAILSDYCNFLSNPIYHKRT